MSLRGEAVIRGNLHLVTGEHHSPDRIAAVAEAVRPWVDRVHLRWKSRPAREVYRLGRMLIERGILSPDRLVIHDRVDIAMALGCGIHLPETGLPVDRVRQLVGFRHPVGVSVHSVAAAEEAASMGADYLLFGHIFPTRSKPGVPPRGVEALSRVVRAVEIPVLAIGGITAERVAEVMKTGCAGVAVLSTLMDSPEPARMALRLRECVDRFREGSDR